MKLTGKVDLEAPAGFVYAMLADHGSWESEALRRGVEIERPAGRPLAGVGAAWRLRFTLRGKMRSVMVKIDEMAPDTSMALAFEGRSFEGGTVMDLVALSPRRTRLRVAMTVKPKTLAARLFLNTLRLARRRVQRRLDKRLNQLAARMEGQYARHHRALG